MNFKTQFINPLFVLLSLLIIQSCGYQLQKPLVIDDQYQPVFVPGNNELSFALRSNLESQGITTTSSSNNAGSTAELTSNSIDARGITLAQDGLIAETQLFKSGLFKWYSSNEVFVEQTELSSERIQTINADTPNAMKKESQTIIKNINNALARQAIQLMKTFNPEPSTDQ